MDITRTTFEAIGTRWDIQVFDLLSDAHWAALIEALHERIEQFDAVYSRFRNDSLVTQISQQADTYTLPEDGHKLLRFYEQLYAATDGKVTPLIGQAIADAGYDAAYSFESKQLKQPPAWNDVLKYDKDHITVTQPVLLDFGAAGKGYLVDILSDLFVAHGVGSYVINAGGDILYKTTGPEAVEIGLENPRNSKEVIGTILLHNQSICASSGTKRQWGAYHHILDPELLTSPRKIAATWVLADDTMTADGIATALFFMKPQQLLKDFSFSYIVLHDDMTLEYTKGLPLTVFQES